MNAVIAIPVTRHATHEIRAQAKMNDRSCASCTDTPDSKPNSPRYQLRQVCSDNLLKGLIFVYNLLSAKCCIQPTNWIAAGVIGKSCRLTVQIKGLGNVSSMGTIHS